MGNSSENKKYEITTAQLSEIINQTIAVSNLARNVNEVTPLQSSEYKKRTAVYEEARDALNGILKPFGLKW